MAAPVVVSTTVNPGEATSKFFDLLARDSAKVNRLTGVGDARVVATTDSATSGTVLNLNDQGFEFPDQTLTVLRMRAWGRGADATEAQYIERIALVLGQPTTPVVANATAVSADAGTVAGTLTCAVVSDEVTVALVGQASQAMNWIVEVNLDEPVYIAKGS